MWILVPFLNAISIVALRLLFLYNDKTMIKMDQKQQLHQWVKTWKNASRELEEIRQREFKSLSIQQAILLLSDAFESAIRQNPPSQTSGLVEQQYWFKRLRS